MNNSIKTFIIGFCLFIFTDGFSQQGDSGNTPSVQDEKPGLATDRPDQTESATLVPAGAVQVETGFAVEKLGDVKSITYNTTLVRIGLSEYFELRLIQEFLGEKTPLGDVKGVSPTLIGTKLKVAEANGFVPEMSFIAHLALKNGAEEFRTPYVGGDFRFSMEWELSEKFGMGINLGAEREGGVDNTTMIYTFVIGFSPTDKIGMFVETYGFLTNNVMDPLSGTEYNIGDHRFNGGMTYAITDLVQFDVSAGVGISEDAGIDNFISTGLSFRLFK